jgi:2-haloalkanoic acid dehalogenase, type II
MVAQQFTDIKIIVFDAFGTLFNLDPHVVQDIEHPLRDQILNYARDKQLSYTWLRSLMSDYKSFAEITTATLTDGCSMLGAPLDLVDDLKKLYFEPTVYSDVHTSLEALRSTSIPLALLSNGTHGMLQSGLQKNGLHSLIDHVFSADDVGIFKPHPKVYQMVCDKMKIKSSEVLFISSNQWDIGGAHRYGYTVCWLNRDDKFMESLIDLPHLHIASDLNELPHMLA